MPPKVDPNEVRIINIKVFGGEPGPAATLAPKLGPLGLVYPLFNLRMPKKLVKTSSKKEANGKELESWFNSDAKIEQQKLQFNHHLQLLSSRNSVDMKEIEKKSRMSLTKET
eukprot:GHVR01071971.1.p1 GENE.GHVR01071971.1~~GHVR01071971.1.p1  ORF type:complete len:112 (-),score=16.13 GHVR01071971.1:63-398(-)